MDNEQIARLAQKSAEGDTTAFNELYRLTRDRAYFVALSITKSEDDAMDMLQEAYLKAWQKRDTLKQPERFVSWFNQIAANTARDFLRARKPLLFSERKDGEADLLDWQPEQEEGYIPHAAMDNAETRRLIMEIVGNLPEDLRLVTLLFYYDDMPLADIAVCLELPMSTVKARLRYARAKISRGVEDLEKHGTKLYGAAPIPLLIWLLRGAAAESAKSLPPVILSGSAAAGGAVTGGVFAGVAVPKLVAAVVAAAVIGGGATTAAMLHRRANTQPVTEPASIVQSAAYANAAEAPLFTMPAFPLVTSNVTAAEPQTQMAGSTQAPLSDGSTQTPLSAGNASPHVTAATTTKATATTTTAAATTITTMTTTTTTTTKTTTKTKTTTTNTTTSKPPTAPKTSGPKTVVFHGNGVGNGERLTLTRYNEGDDPLMRLFYRYMLSGGEEENLIATCGKAVPPAYTADQDSMVSLTIMYLEQSAQINNTGYTLLGYADTPTASVPKYLIYSDVSFDALPANVYAVWKLR